MIKYLGVTIDSKLSFNQHIRDKCKRATTVLNMLKRNLFFAPSSVKSKAYQACVLPIIEYGSTCWSPTSIKQRNSLEMVHHNAAKFVSNIYPRKGKFEHFSIHKVLNELGWNSLEKRRNQSRLIMTYKIINGLVILEPDMMPRVDYQRSRKCNETKVGYKNQLIEPPCNIQAAQSTFFYATPNLWNNCTTPSVEAFRQHFKK